MKTLLFTAALLATAASAFAQFSSDTGTTPSQLAKLRREYIDSLKDLSQQYSKEDKTAAAQAVDQEIAKVTGTTPADSTAQPSPPQPPADAAPACGTWVWHGGVMLVTINADGTIAQDGKLAKATWRWEDAATGKLKITWQSGWVDHGTLSADGGAMDITNNDGGQFTVHRLPKDDDAPAPEHAAD